MATNTIAKASLLLSADGGQLNTGLNKAEQDIKSWGQKQAKQAENIGKNLGDKIKPAAPAGGMFSGLTGKLMSGLVWKKALDEVVGLAQKVKQTFDEVAQKIEATARAARELGVGVQSLAALSYAAKVAGVSVEDLQGALSALQTNLLRTDASRLFGPLALDVDKLRSLPVDEAFARIADALTQVTDPSERARLALSIFGEKAVQLQPLLFKSGDGIRALSEEAKKLGVAFDGVGASKIRQAQEALTRLSAGWEGLKNRATIALAPVFEVGATALKNFNQSLDVGKFSSWQTAGSQAFHAVVKGVALLYDAYMAYTGLFLKYVVSPTLQGTAKMVDAFVNLSGMASSALSALQPYVDAFKEGLAEGWDNVTATWDSMLKSMSDNWFRFTQDIELSLDQMGILWLIEQVREGWQTLCNDLGEAWDEAIQGIIDTLNEWGLDVQAVIDSVKEAFNDLSESFSGVADGIKAAWNRVFARTEAGDVIRGMADEADEAGDAFVKQFGKSTKAVDEFFAKVEAKAKATNEAVKNNNPLDAIKAKVQNDIVQLEKDIRQALNTVGMTGFQAKVFDLKTRGATDKDLEKVKELAEQAKNVDLAWAAVQMPAFEVWERQLQGLDQMLESGRITWEQYAMGVANAGKQLQQAAGLGEIKTTSAQFKDSSAAVSSIIKAQLQDQVQADPGAELRRAVIEAKEIQKKQLAVAEKMLEAIQDQDNEDVFGLM